MDPKSEQLLSIYRNEVEQTARKIYLEAKAIDRELRESKLNPEDLNKIRIHVISILSKI